MWTLETCSIVDPHLWESGRHPLLSHHLKVSPEGMLERADVGVYFRQCQPQSERWTIGKRVERKVRQWVCKDTASLAGWVGFFQKSSVPNTALFDVLSCDQLGIIWLLKWQILPDTIFSSCLCCLNLFGLLYQNNHKPDSVYTTEIYFSWFWKLGIPWSSPWQIQCLAKAHFTRFIGGS